MKRIVMLACACAALCFGLDRLGYIQRIDVREANSRFAAHAEDVAIGLTIMPNYFRHGEDCAVISWHPRMTHYDGSTSFMVTGGTSIDCTQPSWLAPHVLQDYTVTK